MKWLWGLDGGARVETVLMLYPDRATVCVSSQAGCAMACGFCATGQAGFERHLTTGEIVEQVVRATQRRAGDAVAGCPTSCSWGWASRSRTTTAPGSRGRAHARRPRALGPPPHGLDRRHHARHPPPRRPSGLPVNLAVSLHAANDELRNELVPINRRYPLDEVVAACQRLDRREATAASRSSGR